MLSGAAAIGMVALAQSASANDELLVMQDNPANWVMPNGNYASTRYSELAQINKDNVGDLQVAWTFSTGVLRGHEGGPLVIGDVMYIHTPFPNIVYALDLNDDGPGDLEVRAEAGSERHPGDVLRHGQSRRRPMATARSSCIRPTPRWWRSTPRPARWSGRSRTAIPTKGETEHRAPMVYQGQGLCRHLRRRVRRAGPRRPPTTSTTASMVWRGYSTGPDDQTLIDPEKTTHLGKPVGKDSGTATWEGDQWKIGGGTTWGWYSVRSRAQPDLLRHRQSRAPGTRCSGPATIAGR